MCDRIKIYLFLVEENDGNIIVRRVESETTSRELIRQNYPFTQQGAGSYITV